MPRGRPPKHTAPVDYDLIPPDRLAAIKAEARKTVQARKLQEAEEAALAREIETEERRGDPVYEQRDILIDLAPHSAYVMVDGQRYEQGHTYRVDAPVYATLIEIVARSWGHEHEISGRRKNYVAPRNIVLGRTQQGMSF